MIQTAFLGDVVLTLPLVEAARRALPGRPVDMVVAPRAAAVLAGHPDLREAIVYDKRGRDAGPAGFLRVLGKLRAGGYAWALVPHRSIRSALLARAAGIPVRAGFDTSAGRFLFTAVARYEKDRHEIDRNLRLLEAIGAAPQPRTAPRLYPSEGDRLEVDRFLDEAGIRGGAPIVTLAPGTAWNTKRWPEDRYSWLSRLLAAEGFAVVLVGGPDDAALCARIAGHAGFRDIHDASGRLGVLGSAELIRRSALLVCNDSAPLHLAGAVGTPVVAIFGATTPALGFGPTGPLDRVLGAADLPCRPCSVHGGDRCPLGTFECMLRITPEMVIEAALPLARRRGA